MKKALLVITLLAMSNISLANINQQKIATVKKLYTLSGLQQDYNFVKKLSTASLKNALIRDEKVANGEIACLDYDFVTQSQDPIYEEIAKTVKVSVVPNGDVKVNFKNYNETTTLFYKMVCQGNQCLIDDIIEPTGSFKKSLNQCLDELSN